MNKVIARRGARNARDSQGGSRTRDERGQDHPSTSLFDRATLEPLLAEIVKSRELANEILSDESAVRVYRSQFESAAQLYLKYAAILIPRRSAEAKRFYTSFHKTVLDVVDFLDQLSRQPQWRFQLKPDPDWTPGYTPMGQKRRINWRLRDPSIHIDEQILIPFGLLAVQTEAMLRATLTGFDRLDRGAPRKLEFEFLIKSLARVFSSVPEGLSEEVLLLFREARLTVAKGGHDAPKGSEVGPFVRFVRAFLDVVEPNKPHQALPKRVRDALRAIKSRRPITI